VPRTPTSTWALLAADRSLLDQPVIFRATSPQQPAPPGRTWTDDYSTIVQVMSIGGR
jgi:hypothetical protein